MRFLLVGNYGVGNAGDEILKEYFLKRFSNVQWYICSANPVYGELQRLPCGIRSFLNLQWMRTLYVLWKSDGMVFGGGSLFTDVESPHACFVWWVHAAWASVLCKPIYLAFQGIGPFRTKRGEWFARWVVKRAVYISVRDTLSMQRILGMDKVVVQEVESQNDDSHKNSGGMWKKSTEIVQSFDPSILLLEAKNSSQRIKNVFIVIPRFSTCWTKESKSHFVRLLQQIQHNGDEVRLLSFQPNDVQESELCQSFAEALGIDVNSVLSLYEATAQLTDATCVISQRYHGLMLAIASSVPFVALHIQDSDKLNALAAMFGCDSFSLYSFSYDYLLSQSWSNAQKRLRSLIPQYEQLVIQGEQTLKQALQYSCRR